MPSDPRTPTLQGVLNAALERLSARLRVSMPGVIQSYDSASGLALVQPALWETSSNAEGEEVTELLPAIPDVPVWFPGGTAGSRVEFQVQAGDPCVLWFSDRSLDKWKGSLVAGDPVDLRRHHLTDAIALVGSFASSSGTRITIGPGSIQLGGSDAAEALVKGTSFLSNTGAFMAFLSAVSTALGAIGHSEVPTAFTALETALAGYLSTISKTK